MDLPLLLLLAYVAVAVSFTVSAAAGFGGSLVLVPALALVLGTKEGIALAALLLAGNNVAKVAAYRRSLPVRRSAVLIVLISLGSLVGARLLVATPDDVVTTAVLVAFAAAFVVERGDWAALRPTGAWALALGAGLTSGFSGTSGPLKGLAVRNLSLDRLHLVGCLSLLSLFGDASKAAVFAEAGLLTANGWALVAGAVPLMVACTWLGRRCNGAIGERGYTTLFWSVMAGYTLRLATSF